MLALRNSSGRTLPRTRAPHTRLRADGILCSALFLGLAFAGPALGYAAHAPAHASSKDRSHGYLGIKFQDTSDEQIVALHMQGPRGAEIMMVDRDGPAGKAGLQPHDVVVQVDGQNIDAAEDLSRRIRESTPGKVLSLSIMRLGRAMTLTAKLANEKDLERNAWQQHAEPPPDDGVENVLIQRYTVETSPGPIRPRGPGFIGTVLRSAPYTGASLDAMEPQLAGFFGAPPKTGLLVHAVEANSPASVAGLRAGDVVLRVDSLPVASTSDWAKRLRASNGRAVNLSILREKHEMTLILPASTKSHSLLEWPKVF